MGIFHTFQKANTYICDHFGNVACLTGWKEPDDTSKIDPLKPCSEPICNHNNKTCHNGKCIAPNYCACEVGWKGIFISRLSCSKREARATVYLSCNDAMVIVTQKFSYET